RGDRGRHHGPPRARRRRRPAVVRRHEASERPGGAAVTPRAAAAGGATAAGEGAARVPEDRRRRSRAPRNELVEERRGFAEYLARRFGDRGEPLDDLRQVALVGLLKAVERFEPERGLTFTTFAGPTVVGELKRHFRDRTWSVRVPRRLQEL